MIEFLANIVAYLVFSISILVIILSIIHLVKDYRWKQYKRNNVWEEDYEDYNNNQRIE